jgi:hypothetical protein
MGRQSVKPLPPHTFCKYCAPLPTAVAGTAKATFSTTRHGVAESTHTGKDEDDPPICGSNSYGFGVDEGVDGEYGCAMYTLSAAEAVLFSKGDAGAVAACTNAGRKNVMAP